MLAASFGLNRPSSGQIFTTTWKCWCIQYYSSISWDPIHIHIVLYN